MAQCRFALRPDGLFVGAMLGGSTLQELRIACTLAQQEREGGVSPRTSPLAQVRDAGNLLTRAGLSIPTVDVDEIHVHYRDVVDLVNHLRKMGETNSLIQRRESLPRDTALASAAVYTTLFGEQQQHNNNTANNIDDNNDISIPATYQIIYMTGWSPDPSQKKAARRGSATVSFEDISKAMSDPKE
jgi:NADH dehydrogenase [ubiquinone] 1 alpha subcomplex assembly factor 5